MRASTAFPFLFLLMACGSAQPIASEGDTDTDTDADADADTDTDTDSDADADGTMPCDGGEGFWRVTGSASDITVTVDTVSAGTTFDPALGAYEVDTWPATPEEFDLFALGYLSGGDDEFICTFPPPTYECPEAIVTSPNDFLVVVSSLGDCGGLDASYSLEVTDVNGPVGKQFLGNVVFEF